MGSALMVLATVLLLVGIPTEPEGTRIDKHASFVPSIRQIFENGPYVNPSRGLNHGRAVSPPACLADVSEPRCGQVNYLLIRICLTMADVWPRSVSASPSTLAPPLAGHAAAAHNADTKRSSTGCGQVLVYYIKFYLRVENALALLNAIMLGAIGGSLFLIAPVSSLMHRVGKKELLCDHRAV